MTIINLQRLFHLKRDCETREDGMLGILNFCMDLGIISKRYTCPVCERDMTLTRIDSLIDKYVWCYRTKVSPPHYSKRSVRKGSWFELSKLPIIDLLLNTEFFVYKRKQGDLYMELGMAEATVCDWRSFYREMRLDIVMNETTVIGGPGKIVEIDESKLVKRKYHLGKRVNETFILPGSTIYSDCWKSYDCLQDERFTYLRVNHSLHFKDPETGVHIYSIEGTGQLDNYLAEYIWQTCHSSSKDRMMDFIEGAKIVYKPLEKGASEEPEDTE